LTKVSAAAVTGTLTSVFV